MRPQGQLAAAIELLTAVLAEQRPADTVISGYFRARRYIGAKDRARIADEVYGALRHHARLGWWLRHAGWPDPAARGRVLALRRLVDGQEVADIDGLCDGTQHAPDTLEPAERGALDRLPAGTTEHADMPDPVRLECPDWAFAGLAGRDRAAAELTALLVPAPMDLRVNERMARRPKVLDRLRRDGLEAEATPWSPLGIRLARRAPLTGHALFKSGVIEVQDEGSQLVALLADAQPGHQVVDFCAGAGGKSLAMAARMNGKGRVVACDVAAGKLDRTRVRLRRAGVDNIEPHALADVGDRWVSRQKGKFDRVLIDAPCSGTGAWRRNPDSRWRSVALDEVTALQARLLRSASRLAKPGGRVIYATCSLLPDENERLVDAFLAADDRFERLDVGPVWQETVGAACPEAGPYLHLSPLRTGTDGFFVAVLRRRDGGDAARAPAGSLSEPG